MASQIPKGKFTLQTAYQMASGHTIPALGFGVYQTPASSAEALVQQALKIGYRHVDSAKVYHNEKPCADAILASGLAREDVFFTSKVPPKVHTYEGALEAIDGTLAGTGLGYIDLYLIHAPFGGKEARLGVWKALVEAQKAGKVRSIGVSNYGVHHLNELEEYIKTSGIGGKIDVGQWELHPWLPHEDIVAWAQERKVVIQAWGPLARGKRAEEAVLHRLGKKYGKTWAQILVRWSLQKGFVPLPKTEHPQRIGENADVFDFELDSEEMSSLEFKGSYEPTGWDPTVSQE